MEKSREDFLIDDAIDSKASDIHFEPKNNRMLIRFRRDGFLYSKAELDKEEEEALIIRLKLRAGMDISERRKVQKGRFLYSHNDSCYSIRLSLMPTIHGEKLVLRILKNENLEEKLDQLGFTWEILQKLKKISSYPSGLFLFTGTTGSGKTTTQMTLINSMKNQGRNILIIEEPIEYFLDEANQIEVDKDRGFDYGLILRESLRQDPDLIVIGEIRDRESAQTALRAAGTGHLVFATLHTESARLALGRMEELGVGQSELRLVLKGIVSQKLIRKSCFRCLGLASECSYCDGTGYRGRFAVGDVYFSSEDQDLNLFDDLRSMKEQILQRIDNGETDRYEYERNFI